MLTPWEILAFKPLREVMAITDETERRLAALERLESIQKMAATRSRNVPDGKGNNRVIYDPDGNTILKAEEIVQRLLAVEPAKPAAPSTASALAAFDSPPKLELVEKKKAKK